MTQPLTVALVAFTNTFKSANWPSIDDATTVPVGGPPSTNKAGSGPSQGVRFQPRGAEGLDIRDGENIAFADSPEQFAQACLNFLLDPEARWNIARNAWEMVAACYSWEVVSRKFETLLE